MKKKGIDMKKTKNKVLEMIAEAWCFSGNNKKNIERYLKVNYKLSDKKIFQIFKFSEKWNFIDILSGNVFLK